MENHHFQWENHGKPTIPMAIVHSYVSHHQIPSQVAQNGEQFAEGKRATPQKSMRNMVVVICLYLPS